MIRLKYPPPATPPGTLTTQRKLVKEEPTLTLIQYNENEFTEYLLTSISELLTKIRLDCVNWINLGGLGNLDMLRELGAAFNIHPLALEDVVHASQRPKAELFSDHFFIISEMVYWKEQQIDFEQLSLFLTQHAVITIQEEGGFDVFDQVRNRLRIGRGFARKMGTDYLTYALLDAMVDTIYPILECVGDNIEAIEDELMERPSYGALKRLYKSKRVLLQLRRAVWPQRELLNTLIRDDSGLMSHGVQIFLRDCLDHATQIIDLLEVYRDLIAGLMDVYLSSVGVRTNEIIRVLTLVSTIFIPLTFIAGVYGMNFSTNSPFNMPELNWKFGYEYFWGLCFLCAGGLLLFFKAKKWI